MHGNSNDPNLYRSMQLVDDQQLYRLDIRLYDRRDRDHRCSCTRSNCCTSEGKYLHLQLYPSNASNRATTRPSQGEE